MGLLVKHKYIISRENIRGFQDGKMMYRPIGGGQISQLRYWRLTLLPYVYELVPKVLEELAYIQHHNYAWTRRPTILINYGETKCRIISHIATRANASLIVMVPLYFGAYLMCSQTFKVIRAPWSKNGEKGVFLVRWRVSSFKGCIV